MPTTPTPATPSLRHRGTGPVATVYMTVPPAGGRAAAVKVYPSALDKATATELMDEQRTLAALRSVPSILLIDRLDELPDGRPALWMELCAQSLAELVDVGGPLPLPDALGLAETIAAVLADAHSVGIVHGGVTPQNVLFRPAGQPVLADFGLCLRHRYPRQPEATAAYTAPEVLRGAEPTAAADLYGLGAVLHFALTSSSPFPSRPGEPAGEVLLRALGEPPPTVSGEDLPAALPALITALLAKDPGARPASAATVLEVVRELAGSAAEQVTPDADDPGPDFDDFRDELPSLRTSVAAGAQMPGVPIAGPPPVAPSPTAPSPTALPPTASPPAASPPAAPPPPVAPAVAPPPGQPPTRSHRRRQPHPAVLAALAVLAVVVVLVGALGTRGDEPETAAPASSPEPSQPAERRPETEPPPGRTPEATASRTPASVQLEINRLTDKDTSVTLGWRSSKPLTYAVVVAEQGRPTASTRFNGSDTSITLQVRPELKYCFRVQGTDGTHTYESEPRAIRGATCTT